MLSIWSPHFHLTEPLSKSSCRFTNLIFMTVHQDTHISPYHSTLLCDGVSFLGATRRFLTVLSFFEIYLYPLLVKNLTELFSVNYYHVGIIFCGSGLLLLLVLLEMITQLSGSDHVVFITVWHLGYNTMCMSGWLRWEWAWSAKGNIPYVQMDGLGMSALSASVMSWLATLHIYLKSDEY